MTDITAPLAIEYRAAEKLIPYAKNTRTHSAEQLAALEKSMLAFGWTVPCAVAGDDILAGHARVIAASAIWAKGLEIKRCPKGQIPCVDLSSLSPEERRAYIIGDNRLAEKAGWDLDLLKVELGALQEMKFDLGSIGFSLADISEVFGRAPVSGEDEAPDLPKKPITKRGDIWQLGFHRLLCGDSSDADDVDKLFAGKHANLLFTDPPYGVEYSGRGRNTRKQTIKNDDLSPAALQKFLGGALLLLPFSDGANAFVCHGDAKPGVRPAAENAFASAGFILGATIIWVKQAASMGWQDFRSQHEPMLFGWRAGGKRVRVKDRTLTTVWNISRDAQGDYRHPTQKPVALSRVAIANCSRAGDIVADPFIGSGSTIIGADTTGRICYGMEIDPAYCDVSIARWEKITGGKANRVKA